MTPWTVCSPPGSSSKGLPWPEYWSGLPFPPPGDLPNPGIEPRSPALQADSLPSEPPGKPGYTQIFQHFVFLRSSEVGDIDAVHGSSQRKSLEHGSV